MLVQYRQRVPTEFEAGSALLESLPAYSPPDTGRTPDAAELSGTYDAAEQKATSAAATR